MNHERKSNIKNLLLLWFVYRKKPSGHCFHNANPNDFKKIILLGMEKIDDHVISTCRVPKIKKIPIQLQDFLGQEDKFSEETDWKLMRIWLLTK